MTLMTLNRLAIGYVVAALLTVGVAFNLDYETEDRFQEGKNMMRSIFCGMAWPLYASVKAFKFMRPQGQS